MTDAEARRLMIRAGLRGLDGLSWDQARDLMSKLARLAAPGLEPGQRVEWTATRPEMPGLHIMPTDGGDAWES